MATVDDIEDEIGSWSFSTASVSNYERSVQATENRMSQPKTRGRGRGIINPQHMASVRLASEINAMKCHSFPMGHLPTSRELLDVPSENEITSLLRQLGLSGREDENFIRSKTTRKTVSTNEEIGIDGNVPVIFCSDLFRNCNAKDCKEVVEPDKFNPEQPLHEQFTTIAEFGVLEKYEMKTLLETKHRQSKKLVKQKNRMLPNI